MRSKDIKIGEWYRLKSSPDYGYVKVDKIYPKNTLVKGRRFPFITIEVHHVVRKSDNVGFIRIFRLDAIIKDEPYRMGFNKKGQWGRIKESV